MAALTMVIRSLDDLSPMMERVRTLGRNHISYGVKPREFTVVGAALLATLEQDEDFTEQAREAWTIAYTTLAGAMVATMAEATQAA